MEDERIKEILEDLRTKRREGRWLRLGALLFALGIMVNALWHIRRLIGATNVVEKHPDIVILVFLSLISFGSAGVVAITLASWSGARIHASVFKALELLHESRPKARKHAGAQDGESADAPSPPVT